MSDKKIVMNLEAIMGDRFGKYSKYIIQERALFYVRYCRSCVARCT